MARTEHHPHSQHLHHRLYKQGNPLVEMLVLLLQLGICVSILWLAVWLLGA